MGAVHPQLVVWTELVVSAKLVIVSCERIVVLGQAMGGAESCGMSGRPMGGGPKRCPANARPPKA
jgi:hypothetical protein